MMCIDCASPLRTSSSSRNEARMRFRVSRYLCAVSVALFALAPVADAFVIRDGAGRSVSITDPSRIVSVGGAVTEILYAIGLEDRIVAVDTTSLYPQSATGKPKVGYMRQLSPEGVLGL